MSWGYLSVVFGCTIMMFRNIINISSSFYILEKGEDKKWHFSTFYSFISNVASQVSNSVLPIGGATMISMYFCSNLNMVVNAQYCFF